ncbi:hypothetical protein EXIGLDRAFT_165361 [Exidia glandulosa HHB12029]|uniref:HNH nuclease domain-containing protein n=1 Tax=Exidia glandulosa HHB12029 TaxID=1314781 RepID=A0A165N4E7_EXIGL|nr:hypothetical protein EXIGLDRAFT_165361 [Exidia glandulosa HHB12029]
MDPYILDDQFWANALLLQREGDLFEQDRQSSQLLRQFQTDRRATPAWRLDDDVITGILYNVLQSMVDTTRGGASDQERNAHKHIVSCICACASNDSGDAAMDRMAHLATTWIASVYWMLWDFGPKRDSHTIDLRNAEPVLRRDMRRCSITGKYCKTLRRPRKDTAWDHITATPIIKSHIADCRSDVSEGRAVTIRCMQALSGLSVDEFDQILSGLNQPSNAIAIAAGTADSTFRGHVWGLLETDVKDHYRIADFWGNTVPLAGHRPLSHVTFCSRGAGVAPPDVRLLRFHAMVGQVIYGSGLADVFFDATGDMNTCTTPATVTPHQFYKVAAYGPSVLPCRDPSSDHDDGSDYVPDDEDEDEDEDMY